MPTVFERLGQRIHTVTAHTDDLKREFTELHELRTVLPEHADVYNWRIKVTESALRGRRLTPQQIEALIPKKK